MRWIRCNLRKVDRDEKALSEFAILSIRDKLTLPYRALQGPFGVSLV